MTPNTKKKAAGLDALKNLSIPTPATAPVQVANTVPAPTPRKNDKVIFSLHLPETAHNKLRELSFHERQSMTKLILEGVDLLFAKRGISSINELHSDVVT